MSTTVAAGIFERVLGGTLTLLASSAASAPFEIPVEPTVVGRAGECGLVLEDPKVSSAHLEIRATPSGVHLRDLGSRNGTFVDDNRCLDGFLLRASRIRCGDTVLQFTPAVTAMEVETGSAEAFGPLVGASPLMKRLYHRIRKVAPTELTALITGETGTGKELVASAIHLASERARRPFVVIDCGAIPASLAESALFGHERGAFTGAVDRRTSPFVEAEGGTVFLDEVGELPLELQPKLLRVVQERRVKPVGANAYRDVNVRLVAATRRDLSREINDGGFRSDLYFRLAQVRLELPPLRERSDDIPLLIEAFAREMSAPDAAQRISPESLVRLMNHDWPGNVRELKNVIAAALAFASDGGPIDLDEHLSIESRRVGSSRATTTFQIARTEFERTYWQDLHTRCEGNISEMARVSGMARPSVREYLARLGVGGD